MAKKEVTEYKYKLDLYNHRGLLKPTIPREIFARMSQKYGDIIRSVAASRWVTVDEIIEYYFVLDKRLKFDVRREPNEISNAVEEMVEAGLILRK